MVYGIALHSSQELHNPNRKLNTSLIELLSFLFVSLLPNWFCTLTGDFAGDVKGALLFYHSENEFAPQVFGDAIVQELIGAYSMVSDPPPLYFTFWHEKAEILSLFPFIILSARLNNSNNNSNTCNIIKIWMKLKPLGKDSVWFPSTRDNDGNKSRTFSFHSRHGYYICCITTSISLMLNLSVICLNQMFVLFYCFNTLS